MIRFPQYIFPFLKEEKGRDRPKVVGTGILLSAGDDRFVITAAHVVDEFKDCPIGLPDKIVALSDFTERKIVSTSIPDGDTRRDDKLDLAVFKLTKKEAQGFIDHGLRFISPDRVDPNDTNLEGKKYVFTGYPSNPTKFNRPLNQVIPLSVSANCLTKTPEEIQRLGFHPHLHIVVHFEREAMMDTTGKRITAPIPDGMSGGAIWTYCKQREAYKLVGVGIEYEEFRDDKVLVGTRISAALTLLKGMYPESAAHFQDFGLVAYNLA